MLSPKCYEVYTCPEVACNHGDTRQTAFGRRSLSNNREPRRPAHPQIRSPVGLATHLRSISLPEPERLEQPVEQASAFENDFSGE